jgi:hypothetical protein
MGQYRINKYHADKNHDSEKGWGEERNTAEEWDEESFAC